MTTRKLSNQEAEDISFSITIFFGGVAWGAIPVIATLLFVTGCGVLGFGDQPGNDTQLGDDDDDGEETGEPDLEPVEDHGLAQYCVDRAEWLASGAGDRVWWYDLSEVQEHERWYHPLARSYVNHLDLSDKPSPMVVAQGCAFGWPHEDMFELDAAVRGGAPSCMSSGYHLQPPYIGTHDYTGREGDRRWPYSADLVTGTFGNPPQSGRHTWMGPACCPIGLTEEEQDGLWLPLDPDGQPGSLSNLQWDSEQIDCVSYVWAAGVDNDAAGFPALYDPPTMDQRAMDYTMCIPGGGDLGDDDQGYSPIGAVKAASKRIGTMVPYHPTRRVTMYPANINYDWAASLGLIEWDDFAAFGETIDAVIQALIGFLYLPPSDFEHARYGLGGGCYFPTAVRLSSGGGWSARFTCPIGYYAKYPDFSFEDPDNIANGVVGSCVLDGVDYGNMGFGAGGDVLSPLEEPGYFFVVDQEEFRRELDLTDGVVTESLASMMTNATGERLVREGDLIAWWSSPDDQPMEPSAAMLATIGRDDVALSTLGKSQGWHRDETIRWVDVQPIAHLHELLAKLPAELVNRTTPSLRAHKTWQVRVETLDGWAIFLHFVG